MDGTDGMTVAVTENGPYLVSGAIPLAGQTIVSDGRGDSVGWDQGDAVLTKSSYALCRCGHSGNKPFCDGSHERVEFDGTETASREPYLQQAGELDGPTLSLTDAESLCAFARFCDVAGQVWSLVGEQGEEAARLTVLESGLCPSGRLVAWERASKMALEPELPASIGLVADPEKGVAGPIWARGGLQVIAADGHHYERRNRVTLCRCGASDNKPFCDGSHAAIGFQA